jgi:hypothetical protein
MELREEARAGRDDVEGGHFEFQCACGLRAELARGFPRRVEAKEDLRCDDARLGGVSERGLFGLLAYVLVALGLGLVLGPEAPLIALGLGMGAVAVRIMRSQQTEAQLLTLAGAFAAVSCRNESPDGGPNNRSTGRTYKSAFGALPLKLALVTEPCGGGLLIVSESVPSLAIIPATWVPCPWSSVASGVLLTKL